MYQRLTIVGNLGRDPEMRYTPNGTAVTQFSVATSKKWTDTNGERKEETAWFRVSAFGKQAETCNQYLTKGNRVLVEGELIVDPETGGPHVYSRKDGSYGASFEMSAKTVRFLTQRGKGDETELGEEGDGVTPITYGNDDNLPF